jgi:hypothetical protein
VVQWSGCSGNWPRNHHRAAVRRRPSDPRYEPRPAPAHREGPPNASETRSGLCGRSRDRSATGRVHTSSRPACAPRQRPADRTSPRCTATRSRGRAGPVFRRVAAAREQRSELAIVADRAKCVSDKGVPLGNAACVTRLVSSGIEGGSCGCSDIGAPRGLKRKKGKRGTKFDSFARRGTCSASRANSANSSGVAARSATSCSLQVGYQIGVLCYEQSFVLLRSRPRVRSFLLF